MLDDRCIFESRVEVEIRGDGLMPTYMLNGVLLKQVCRNTAFELGGVKVS